MFSRLTILAGAVACLGLALHNGHLALASLETEVIDDQYRKLARNHREPGAMREGSRILIERIDERGSSARDFHIAGILSQNLGADPAQSLTSRRRHWRHAERYFGSAIKSRPMSGLDRTLFAFNGWRNGARPEDVLKQVRLALEADPTETRTRLEGIRLVAFLARAHGEPYISALRAAAKEGTDRYFLSELQVQRAIRSTGLDPGQR